MNEMSLAQLSVERDEVRADKIDMWAYRIRDSLEELGSNEDQKFQKLDIDPGSEIYRGIENAVGSDREIQTSGRTWNPELYEAFRIVFEIEGSHTDKELYWVSDPEISDKIGVTIKA